MRSSRRRDLLRILHAGHASSQSEIADELRAAGHDVTQATVSRDLRAVGAVKVKLNGGFTYRLPDEIPRSSTGDLMARNLVTTLKEFAVDVAQAASIVVVTTAPGHASAVARAIDLAGVAQVVGTIAGDDTIFVATPSKDDAELLANAWGDLDDEHMEVLG
jgi:transcriptional regulator of arginine metabolism